MIKTRDGELVKVGMWISNTAGIYEVTEIGSKYVTGREIVFDEENEEKWEYGDTHYWLHSELKHFDFN